MYCNLATRNQLLQVVDDVYWFEDEDVAFKCVEHDFCGITHQCAREAGASDRADDRDDSL